MFKRQKPKKKVCYLLRIKLRPLTIKMLNCLRDLFLLLVKSSRRVTGTSAKYQRMLAKAIKNARYMALLPYIAD